jgi:RNA polymerase sigma factor (sigma-70 family)
MGELRPVPNDALPQPLAQLLAARDSAVADVAWRGFVDAYSTLLLQVARSTAQGHDRAMDAYTFLLEQLQEQECRRLRVYVAKEGTRFSTWLLVVARRLCIDYHRRQYGRPQGPAADEPTATLERATRRRLVDLASDEIELDTLADAKGHTPESEIRATQLRGALAAAIDALGTADRLLLVMRFEDGRSAAAIARAMGFATPFHVYRRLAHVLDRLRKHLVARGIHDPTP